MPTAKAGAFKPITQFAGHGHDPKTGHYWGWPPADWMITGLYCRRCGAVSDEASGEKPCRGADTYGPPPEKWVVRLGLTPQRDGNQWSFVWGDNVQEGVCGFGASPAEAIEDFEWAMNVRIEAASYDPDDPRTTEERRAGLSLEAITVMRGGRVVWPKPPTEEGKP